MKILVVGSEGSMGKRYQAILKHLGHDIVTVDKQHTSIDVVKAGIKCDRIIVATPTETHAQVLDYVLLCGKPVLCEKPICTDLEELKGVLDHARSFNPMLAMVMQYKRLLKDDVRSDQFYKFLDDPSYDSHYHYFRHGNDGLKWDCFQIIALAEGRVTLGESSPIWKCKINGQTLNLSDMDQAYVDMLDDWIRKPYSDIDTIYEMHEKVSKYAP